MSKSRARSWKIKHPPRLRIKHKREVELVADVKGYYDFIVFDYKTGIHLGYAENGVFYRDLYGRDCVAKVEDLFVIKHYDLSVFELDSTYGD